MKAILNVIILLFLLSFKILPQENDYWKNAPVEGNRIYSICFIDQQNGYAVSPNNENFITTDSGITWDYLEGKNENSDLKNDRITWSANIYCSVMQTTDGGKSWSTYSKEKQDHFCKVYLKDPNAGYQTAYEFLNKVTSTIFTSINNNNIHSLIDNPQQCTEYYCNEVEGWALGWCMKEFKMREKD
jgi:hypothetical protein